VEDDPLGLARLGEDAQRAARLFARIHHELEQRPVLPNVDRATIRASFRDTIGEEGIGLDAVLDEVERFVLPHSMGTPHPLYLGLVNSSPLPAAAVGDLLVSALNNNAGAFEQGPAVAAAEEEVVRAFARLARLPEKATGMVLPGGSLANLQGLLLARARRFPAWAEEGPRALPGAPRVYVSASSHFSAGRAAEVMGLGRAGVVEVPSDATGALLPSELARAVADDRAAGRIPFAVVATAGTTGTGAIDPLEEIVAICAREDLWLHVDACYGGGALLLDELADRFRGLERADSVAIDPHKWFFVPITAALLLTPHADLETTAFQPRHASYIPVAPGERPDAYRRGVPTSRRGTAVAVWMGLRAHGWAVLRDAVRRNVALMRRLEADLARRGFRILPDLLLSVACARYEPEGVDDLDALQVAIAEAVKKTGQAWFSTVVHQGRTWLRFNLVNLHTRERHVDRLAALVSEAAEEVAR